MRILLCLIALIGAVPAWAEAVLIGSYHWKPDDPLIGGLSGVEVLDQGQRYIAITDRGVFVTGRFIRDEGVVSGIVDVVVAPMIRTNGTPLGPFSADSEGIAVAPDGTIFVSYEGTHGVRSFASTTAPASRLSQHPDFTAMQSNSSLEALAIGPDGALYTLPERSGRATVPFPVYRLLDGVWDQPFALRRDGAFLAVGADIGPDGRFYLLERDFTGFGFRTRVRRFDMHGGSEETILQTRATKHDNLEGLSVWRDDTGGLRLTMVSDDNFRFFQQTQIVEYALDD